MPRGATLIRGDALRLPLLPGSVNLSISSPPYFALRSYQDGGEHYAGQIGSEAGPVDFLRALWAVADEVWRALADDGSAWWNLGDKYAGSGGHNNSNLAPPRTGEFGTRRHDTQAPRSTRRTAPDRYNQTADVRVKSLMGLPWRFAMGLICPDLYRAPLEPSACWHDDGPGPCRTCPPRTFPQWIGRAEVIWSKPNGLPESVTDRPRRSHEQWFMVTKQPRYFAAVDEVREVQLNNGHVQASKGRAAPSRGLSHREFAKTPEAYNPLGKLPGSVRSVPSEPLKVPDHLGIDHFAAFPQEWPRWIIAGWSPRGICTACGEGRRPVRGVDWSKVPHRMERKRVLTHHQRAAWSAAFADWCDQRGISRPALDAVTSTNGMAGHWTSRRSQPDVPTPEQWAKLVTAFGPMPDELAEVVHSTKLVPVALIEDGSGHAVHGRHKRKATVMSVGDYSTITGYACACPDDTAPTRPAVVLDPFAGTGTVPMVARALGRYGIGVDLSRDYLRLANWRVFQSGHGRKTEAKTHRLNQGTLFQGAAG